VRRGNINSIALFPPFDTSQSNQPSSSKVFVISGTSWLRTLFAHNFCPVTEPQTINLLTVFVICTVRVASGKVALLTAFHSQRELVYTSKRMSHPTPPNLKLSNVADYRENYANSVQMRVNIWDFFLVFGTLQQQSETQVEIRNFQGIYLSPQQAKALLGLLQQNVSGYESAFGEIKLDPRMGPHGPVH